MENRDYQREYDGLMNWLKREYKNIYESFGECIHKADSERTGIRVRCDKLSETDQMALSALLANYSFKDD